MKPDSLCGFNTSSGNKLHVPVHVLYHSRMLSSNGAIDTGNTGSLFNLVSRAGSDRAIDHDNLRLVSLCIGGNCIDESGCNLKREADMHYPYRCSDLGRYDVHPDR